MRLDDITDYLTSTREILESLTKSFNEDELSYTKIRKSKLTIYSAINGLRTCLDHAFLDCVDILVRPNFDPKTDPNNLKKQLNPRHSPSFPYQIENHSEFLLQPILKKIHSINPNVSELLESLQPYGGNRLTIKNICLLSNELKHE